jgi:hypothetical protein
MIFWTLNYTTWELLDPQLDYIGTSGPSIIPQKFMFCVIFDSEVHLWCN